MAALRQANEEADSMNDAYISDEFGLDLVTIDGGVNLERVAELLCGGAHNQEDPT